MKISPRQIFWLLSRKRIWTLLSRLGSEFVDDEEDECHTQTRRWCLSTSSMARSNWFSLKDVDRPKKSDKNRSKQTMNVRTSAKLEGSVAWLVRLEGKQVKRHFTKWKNPKHQRESTSDCITSLGKFYKRHAKTKRSERHKKIDNFEEISQIYRVRLTQGRTSS
jgi:hypothetical protein